MSEVAEMPPTKPRAESSIENRVEYLSPAAKVSMADQWFEIASTDHFWVQRRFSVLQKLAGQWLPSTKERGEIGCGHGLLQRQIEDAYGLPVTGFDLNDFALKQNISRISRVCCYDIFQRNATLRAKFDVIFLFDVLEHISDQDAFLQALLFHLAPQGRVVINVPAGQWALSGYDRAAGHVRRYSFERPSRGSPAQSPATPRVELLGFAPGSHPRTPQSMALRQDRPTGHHPHRLRLALFYDKCSARDPLTRRTHSSAPPRQLTDGRLPSRFEFVAAGLQTRVFRHCACAAHKFARQGLSSETVRPSYRYPPRHPKPLID